MSFERDYRSGAPGYSLTRADNRDGASMPRGSDPIRYCDGCGGVHGSIGVELACLRTKLAETREALARMMAAAVLRVTP